MDDSYKLLENDSHLKTNVELSQNKEPQKCDYFLIDEACIGIMNTFKEDDLQGLYNALDALSNFLKEQKLDGLPILFQKFNIINIINTILKNESRKYTAGHFINIISSLATIFWAKEVSHIFLSDEIIFNICQLILNFDKVFSYNNITKEEISAIGDSISIIRAFINLDNSSIDKINSILPLKILIDMPMNFPFKNPGIDTSFAAYFFTYFEQIDSALIDRIFQEQSLLFIFCHFCYQNGMVNTYRYNLWSISEVILKLGRRFNLNEFVQMGLADFVNASILFDNNKIVFPALRIISLLHTKFLPETKASSEEPLIIDPSLFDVVNLVMIPRDRTSLNEDTKLYSITVIRNVLIYNFQHFEMLNQFCLPEYLIGQFCRMGFNWKKEVCTLFLVIIQRTNEEYLFGLINEGLMNIFIDLLATNSMVLEILLAFKQILEKFQTSDNLPLIITFLQDDTFQTCISELAVGDDKTCADIAKILISMTDIGEEEF